MRNLLKIKRWEAKIKQYELANLLKCSAPYLSMVENGRTEPSEEFMRQAAKLLEVEIDQLFPEWRASSRPRADGRNR